MFHTVVVLVLEIEIDDRMIDEVGTDACEIADKGNFLAFEMICRTDTRKQEDLGENNFGIDRG